MKEEGTCIDDIFWMREKECLLKRMFAREKETRRANEGAAGLVSSTLHFWCLCFFFSLEKT